MYFTRWMRYTFKWKGDQHGLSEHYSVREDQRIQARELYQLLKALGRLEHTRVAFETIDALKTSRDWRVRFGKHPLQTALRLERQALALDNKATNLRVRALRARRRVFDRGEQGRAEEERTRGLPLPALTSLTQAREEYLNLCEPRETDYQWREDHEFSSECARDTHHARRTEEDNTLEDNSWD